MKITAPFRSAFFLGALALMSCFSVLAQSQLPSVELKLAWPNLRFNRPLFLCEAPDGTHRIFLLEQDGRIWILPADRQGTEPKLFLDISSRQPHQENEEGLLAMAFHPQFKTNGKFYVFYTQQNPKRNMLCEFQVSKNDPDKADPSTERELFRIRKTDWNHNGATLLFGPDGYLYFGLGDGGSWFDPHEYAQNLHVFFGKMLRIDVNSRTGALQYGIPKDNPFVEASKAGGTNAPRAEIWAYGLRNPWRISFDRETGDLWVGDVGQDLWEEVEIVTKGGNYGWSAREGFHDLVGTHHPALGTAPIDPIIEYPHKLGQAGASKFPNHSAGNCITGGYVYRGKKISALRGVYVYGDFQVGTIWGLRYENGKVTADDELIARDQSRNISSFGEDAAGELYVLTLNGDVYQIVEAGK
jgi:hypothetical protein